MIRNEQIVQTIAKAFLWKERMEVYGTDLTLSRIAAEENISDRYARQIYAMNYLSPNIVLALMEGHNPQNRQLKDFKTTLPASWWKQEQWFFGEE